MCLPCVVLCATLPLSVWSWMKHSVPSLCHNTASSPSSSDTLRGVSPTLTGTHTHTHLLVTGLLTSGASYSHHTVIITIVHPHLSLLRPHAVGGKAPWREWSSTSVSPHYACGGAGTSGDDAVVVTWCAGGCVLTLCSFIGCWVLRVHAHDCGAKELSDIWGHTWRTELHVQLFLLLLLLLLFSLPLIFLHFFVLPSLSFPSLWSSLCPPYSPLTVDLCNLV